MGLAAARELRRRGNSVTLLERASPGRAASWASAGIIGATLRIETDPSVHMRRIKLTFCVTGGYREMRANTIILASPARESDLCARNHP